MFLLETPGFTVDGNQFSDTLWRLTGYSTASPQYLTAQLVDRIPAFANYFVDSGYRVSTLWEQMLTNAQTESRFSKPDATLRYNDAVQRLYSDSFAPRDLVVQRDSLLQTYSNAFDKAVDNRYQCLERDNKGGAYCSQKATIWKQSYTSSWFDFETLNRDVMGIQSQILQVQGSDLNLLLASAQETLASYRRSEVGLTNLFSTFYSTSLSPSNWYQWFWSYGLDPTSLAAANAAFVQMTFSSTEQYTERTPTFDRYFNPLSTAARFNRPMIRVTSGDPSVSDGYVGLTDQATTSALSISFEIAKVKIIRPWFDMGLLRYSPIAVTGLVAGAWSTGTVDANAMFPMLPTSFIVARNVYISSSWSASMSSILTQATNTSFDTNVQIGPFTIGSNNNQYTSPYSKSSAASFNGQSIFIRGPMIIGWVCKTLNFVFPNANVDELGTSTTPSTTAFPPPSASIPIVQSPADIFNSTLNTTNTSTPVP